MIAQENLNLPSIFNQRFRNGNFRIHNSFSEKDNYNRIQDYGEYLDEPYGKRYIKDVLHESNEIFSKYAHFMGEQGPRSKVDVSQLKQTAANVSKINHRFHRNRFVKYPIIDNESVNSDQLKSDEYAKLKQTYKSDKSLLLESELLGEVKNRKAKTAFPAKIDKDINKWKYSFHSNSMSSNLSRLQNSRSANIDLSKY